MPAEASPSRLATLMNGLRVRLDSFSEGHESAQEALRAVFAVNNELGRLARGDESLRSALIEVQSLLNLVTIELKRGRPADALEAYERANRSLGVVEKEKVTRRPQKEFISSAGYENH
jgi:hypothetical protein